MLNSLVFRFILLLTIAGFSGNACLCPAQTVDWPVYNGGVDGDHYSKLTQIDRGNVSKLQVAWSFDTGEKGGIQSNPLIVGRTLYTYTPTQKVVALDAATGKLKWKFDSEINGTQPARGLAYWTDGRQGRIFVGVMNFLYCLDAETGKPIEIFGESGRVDLRKGLERSGNYEQQSIALTSPGVVYKDLIIVGGRNPETHPAPPGYVRAYDVRTGQLRWVFHTIPLPGEPGYETWPKDAYKTAGAANNWAGMTLDAARGIVYVPTGSAVMDFYGGDRVGDDLYANCELALDANTGKLLWYFQGVHHDIWDRDFPSPPALVTVNHDGKTVDALAQTSKQGFVYLFDRVTGQSLYPMNERPYPASTVPGEVAAKTQSLPGGPEPYARQRLTEDMLTTRTPEMHAWAVQAFRDTRSDGQFLPMVVGKQTVIFPGFDGGAEWGGPAVDPVNDILYVNANEMAWLGGLVPNPQGGSPGARVYREQCAVCHGIDRTGSPPSFPSLVGIEKKVPDEKIAQTVKLGTGRMPSFPNIDDTHMAGLLNYLRTGDSGEGEGDKKELGSSPTASGSSPPPADPRGEAVFKEKCAVCHGEHREGAQDLGPTLMGLGSRLSADQVRTVINGGKRKMPQIPDVIGKDMDALLRFLGVGQQTASVTPPVESEEGPYIFTGYRKFLDPEGYPAFVPPWGTLNAIDLKTGMYLWKVPLGEYPALAQQGMKNTGSENYGGPVLTAGGVLFIGATVYDRRFRAFDSSTGKVLWETELPFAGMATPSTYMIDGRQYVVIASSGGRDPKSPVGGAYIAFALPAKE
jgi:glucose dehydrogenase